MSFKKYIPRPFKHLLAGAYVFTKCLLPGRPTDESRLNLAGVLPGPGEVVHGGKVKLLHLRERFGDTWKRFNVAYFVSSGLPFAPAIWLKTYELFQIKIIWNQNGVAYPALYTPEVVARINGLYKSIYLSDYVVYQTEFTKKCADRFVGKFSGPSSILPNPVDTELFTPRPEPLARDPLVLIMTGNHLESRERMLISLQAVRLLHESGTKTKLIILGNLTKNSVITEKEIDEEIEHLELREWVEKKGAFSQEEAPDLYRSAHMLLHLKYLDPCPTVVIEALSCGLPAVGSASGGMPELVDKCSGVLVPITEDFDKLHYPSVKEVVSAVLEIKSNLKAFSENAREQAVLKFDKKQWLDKHEEIFKTVLKNKNG